MAVNWNYYNKYEAINDRYLPLMGEGNTKATQIVTATTNLIYKWYNDYDVYDNTYYLEGCYNNISSYANWLAKYTHVSNILNKIKNCKNDSDYEDLLKEIADNLLNENYLYEMNKMEKVGNIYKCEGVFKFNEK